MAAKTQKFETRIDLADKTRTAMVKLLNQQLADTFDLYSQIKQSHWNVKGIEFMQLHELFDDIAESMLEYSDMIAERATALGGTALGTVRLAADSSTLPELPADVVRDKELLALVADRVAAYGKSTRAAIDAADEAKDQGTADLFTEVSRGVDKHLYFLDAHLQA